MGVAPAPWETHRPAGCRCVAASVLLLLARAPPSLTFCARLLQKSLPLELLLLPETQVEEPLLLVALSRKAPPVADLLVALLEGQDDVDALRVVVQGERWMHGAGGVTTPCCTKIVAEELSLL